MRAVFGCALVACSSGNLTGDGIPQDGLRTDTGTTPGPGDSDDTDLDDTGAPGGPGVVGVLLDPTGQPLDNFVVLCCTTTVCYKGESEDDGSFAFEVDPGRWALKTHEELFETPRWAAALEPASIVGSELVDLSDLYIPDLPAGVPFGDESEGTKTLAAGDGLELTLDVADLEADLGVFLFDVAARKVPDAYVPQYEDLGGETIVAVYAIHPFATTSSSPIGVRAPATLAAGTVVHFRSMSNFDATFSLPAIGTSDGTYVTTDPGEGIDLLTYLVISTP